LQLRTAATPQTPALKGGNLTVSVVINTYNGAEFLGSALQSVAAQTWRHFEVLVVDDGSTDNTAEIVQQFAARFPALQYERKQHTGLADSRNYALRQCSGTHIAFLDADDLWMPRYLEVMAKRFAQTSAKVLYANGARVTPKGKVVEAFFATELQVDAAIRAPSAANLFDYFVASAPSSTMVARSAFAKVGPYDARFPISHDRHWLIRAMLQGVRCARILDPLVIYRFHGDNLSSHTDQLLLEWLDTYQELSRRMAGRDFHRESRALAYRLALVVISKYPGPRSRALLRRARQTLGEDNWLRAANSSTYLGLRIVLSAARVLKRAWQSRRFPAALRTADLAPMLSLLGEIHA
jgi:cellulose synthase/poly-beta-1,6-N-acetylglucosamine synthase-like glycosyltransferase